MDNVNIDPETLEIQAPDYTTEIVEILKSNLSPKALKDKIMDYHENDMYQKSFPCKFPSQKEGDFLI